METGPRNILSSSLREEMGQKFTPQWVEDKIQEERLRERKKLRKVSFPSEQKVDDFFIPICDSLVMTESPVGIQQGHRPASTH